MIEMITNSNMYLILGEYWQNILYTDGFRMTGVAMTLWLLILSAVIGWVLSVFLAVARSSKKAYLRMPVWTFTYLFRGTPFYIQLLLIYNGVIFLEIVKETSVLKDFFRVGFNCAMLALVLNTAAYTTEIIAGAIKNVGSGQIEAAQAYGMSRFQIYTRIILPTALRTSLPSYGNEVILLLHCTSLAFGATVPELFSVIKQINAKYLDSINIYILAGCIYLVISYTLIALFRIAEKRWLSYLQPVSQH
ncbi:histidine transport system permease protein [Thorsellia anophelis DSM 18579]|uniref:Histidine/lysine/arginine/ornithine transport system permease protein HisM n=2 Tax=Thorsellia anophelis TaxID=336804 RepID=A0A1H9Y5V1_9GAMM|nr:histidine transport system permease protein [Thorsellia anophelis DSM 18579]